MTLHSGFLTSAGVEVTWKCCLPAKKTVLRSINVTQHPSFSLPEPPKVYFNSPLLLPSRNLRRYISTHLIFLLTGTSEFIFQLTSSSSLPKPSKIWGGAPRRPPGRGRRGGGATRRETVT